MCALETRSGEYFNADIFKIIRDAESDKQKVIKVKYFTMILDNLDGLYRIL